LVFIDKATEDWEEIGYARLEVLMPIGVEARVTHEN